MTAPPTDIPDERDYSDDEIVNALSEAMDHADRRMLTATKGLPLYMLLIAFPSVATELATFVTNAPDHRAEIMEATLQLLVSLGYLEDRMDGMSFVRRRDGA